MDLPKLWAFIEADLARARSTLPGDALSHKAVRDYREFLDHNELELACDMLEAYAKEHPVKSIVPLAVWNRKPDATRLHSLSQDVDH
jgi:hypothetical protein